MTREECLDLFGEVVRQLLEHPSARLGESTEG